ncbi:MAG: family 20 glycosylhydrolase [Candidatus Onthomonas sp.]
MLKKLTKGLSLLLALCMLVALLPAGALAVDAEEEPEVPAAEQSEPAEAPTEEETPVEEPAVEDEPVAEEPAEEELTEQEPSEEEAPVVMLAEENTAIMLLDDGTDDSTFYKIVHLDCGRKYFSKDWIIALINEMAADGYNQLQLAFGNDGLRFLLDDMSFIANETTYSHASVVSAVEAGNENQNSSGDKRWLTQSEMDEIITTANSLGIEIVPLLNLPGHANTILDIAGDVYNVSGSDNTLDMSKEDAVKFAMAIFQKYVDYFAGKGCKFFNFGADEYANDISSGSFSFSRLDSAGYQSFVDFINSLAAYIEQKGMTPRAFNDGLYYGSHKNVSIDTDIQCCYWSNGWSGYDVASASAIADKDHSMINTNGDFYYVLGKSDQFDSDYSYASNFSNTQFMGSEVSDPAGSMFCIWCDYPNAETEQEIAVNTRLVLRAMAARMSDKSIDDIDTSVVTNGFNADGTINKTSIQKDGESVSTFSVKMGGTATLSLSDSTATATWSSSNESVATVAAVTRSVEANSVTVTPVGEGTATITAELSDGTKLTTDVTVTAAGTSDEPAYDKVIELEVGQEENVTDNTGNYESSYTDEGLDTSIATVTVTGKTTEGTPAVPESTKKVTSLSAGTYIIGNGTQWLTLNDTTLGYTTDASQATQWTIAASGNSCTIKSGSYYLRHKNNNLSASANNSNTTWSYNSSTGFYYTSGSSTYYLRWSGSAWEASTTKSNYGAAYTYTPGQAAVEGTAYTTITFKGVYPGTTYVKVGETTYQIVVSRKSKDITVILNEGTVTDTQTKDITEEATIEDNSIVSVEISGATVTFTGLKVGTTTVTVGDTIYNVKVSEVDLSTVEGLTVEFWITNRTVTANNSTSMTINASDSGVYSESGARFSDLVPASGVATEDTSAVMAFWKGTRLATDNKQTTGSGVDKTTSGTDFTYIRYWNGSWDYSSDGKTWTNVVDGDQIVAYYLQVTDVTDEITTQVVDWGHKKAKWSELNYLGTKYVLVDYTVKYESGEETPSSFPTDNSLGFHCDTQTKKDNYYYRTLGMIRGVETADYEVYMITLTPTSDSPSTVLASTAAGNTSYTYEGTEVVAWAATQEDMDNSGLGTYTSISGAFTYSIGGEPIVSGLEIYRQQGMKVTFYVRAKQTEDSLSVHYIDQTANQEFYSYNIAVKSGTLFDKNIGLADPWKGNLANGSVTNSLGKTQTVSADLSTMPAIGAQYRYSDYTCVKVERSEDGKDVYLYYTFNNAHSFVVDFGLPLKITTEDLGIDGDWTSASVNGAQYGTATASIGEDLTYTPTKTLEGVEMLQLTLTGSTGSVTHQIYIYPATTVYYEEGFAELTGFTGGSKGTDTQATQVAGSSSDEYGYDAKYSSENNGASNGTEATSSSVGDKATFTFTGTGVDVYANCTPETGRLSIQVKDSSGSTVKLIQVQTALLDGLTTATGGGDAEDDFTQAVTGYNVPVASITGLEHATYTVTVTHMKGSSEETEPGPVYLDGFRVYGTLEDQKNSVYTSDLEDDPTFIELRDEVLTAQEVDTTGSQYASQIAGQVYSASNVTSEGAIILSANEEFTSDMLKDLLDNGPKNEIYLQQNQALVFTIKTDRVVQIGLKALNASTSYTINNDNSEALSTSTDMFYTVLNKGSGDATNGTTITITNKGGGILAVTKLKVCDDPNATLGTLTEEDLIPALLSLGFEEEPGTTEPTEPEVTYADAQLNITVTAGADTLTTGLTANGVVGESITFTADEIRAAVEGLTLPEGYVLGEQDYSETTVAYGETEELTFTASEEVVEPEPEPEPAPDPEPEPEPEQPAQSILQKLSSFLKKLIGWL